MYVVLFALMAAFGNSIFSLASRFIVYRGYLTAFAATLLVQGISGILAVAVVLGLGIRWQAGAALEMWGVVVISLLGFTLMNAAFAREDASAVAPLIGIKAVFLALIEAMLLRQSIGLGVAGGAVMSVAGVMLSSQTDQWSLHPRDILRPGVAMMLLAAVCFALCDLLIQRSLAIWHGASMGVALYIVSFTGLISFLILAGWRWIPGLVTLGVDGMASPWSSIRPTFIPVLISAVTNVLTQFVLFTAFVRAGQVTLPNIIYNTRSLMVVALAAVMVLGWNCCVERAGWRAYLYRTLGAILTLAAVALAVLAK